MSNYPLSVPVVSIDGDRIRKIWHNNEWYFSVVDMIAAVLDHDTTQASTYWRKLKQRLREEENETIAQLFRFKLPSADQKMRFTDVADEKTCREIRQIVERVSFDRAKRVKLSRDELINLHPLVKVLLEAEGWQVSHHIDLPSGKTMDIVAERAEHVMIVECKRTIKESNIFRAVGQVLCYVAEYGNNAKPAIACLPDGIDDYAYQMCLLLDIRVITV